jgi:S-formylglutathione hydrolase FrmB
MRALVVVALVACSQPSAPAPQVHEAVASSQAAAAKGKVLTQTFHSEALGVDKDYLVYLPAGYDAKPNVRWPVFYYLHGLTGKETDWEHGGHLDEAADAMGLGAIVVMPDGDDGFYSDWVTEPDYDACMRDGTGLFLPQVQKHKSTCVRHRRYETYIVHDLIGEIDSHFRTLTTRDGRAIAGLSMGGFGALELSMRHPDLFSAAASHSGVDALLYRGPHPYVGGKVELLTNPNEWGGGIVNIGTWVRQIYGTDIANWQAHDPATLVGKLEPGKLALYLDCGTDDDFALNDQAAYLHDLLVARKIDHAYFLGPGHHDFGFWRPRLPESLKFLRDHTSAAR